MGEKGSERLAGLSALHETPFFALDAKRLAENQENFLRAARKHFPGALACYSVKTNSHSEVLSRIKTGFDSASVHEIRLAGKPKGFSVYNSPAKTVQSIKEAVGQGYLVVADSLEELGKIAQAAGEMNAFGLRIGLRMSVGSEKFGIQPDRIPEARKKAVSLGLEPALFHAHPGTKQKPEQYNAFLCQIKKRIPSWAEQIDLGGGIPSQSSMKRHGWEPDDYFGAAKEILGQSIEGKTVVFEPGRSIAEDAITLLTKVVAAKQSKGVHYAVCDAGINVLGRITLSEYDFEPLQKCPGGETKLVGPTLFASDILSTVPCKLSEGDTIAVHNAGAYSQALAWELSYPKPRMLVI